MVFKATVLHCKATLGQGQPELMIWILWWIMPHVQDRSLDLLTSALPLSSGCPPKEIHPEKFSAQLKGQIKIMWSLPWDSLPWITKAGKWHLLLPVHTPIVWLIHCCLYHYEPQVSTVNLTSYHYFNALATRDWIILSWQHKILVNNHHATPLSANNQNSWLRVLKYNMCFDSIENHGCIRYFNSKTNVCFESIDLTDR